MDWSSRTAFAGPGRRACALARGKAWRNRLLAGLAMVVMSSAVTAADLVLNHSDDGFDPVPAGGLLTYTLRVDNNTTNAAATGVVLRDTLPPGVVFVDAQPSQGSCAAPAGGVVSCSLGSIPASGVATVLVTVRPQSAGTIENVGEVTSAESDPDLSNNTRPQTTTVTQGADLAIQLIPSSPTVQAGGALNYAMRVSNAGPDAATSLRVVNTLPPGYTATSLPLGCSQSGSTVTCNVAGPIAPNATVDVGTIQGEVWTSASSTLTDSASVSVVSPSAAQDPTSANNTVTANTTVTAGTDLRIVKGSTGADTVTVGTEFDYTLAVSYTGDAPVGMEVVDTLPSQVALRNPGAFSSGGWSCTVLGQTVRCTWAGGALGAGRNVNAGTISIGVRAVTAFHPVNNVATISSSTPDVGNLNNSSTKTIAIVDPAADLRAEKRGPSPALATVGSKWQWQVRLHNDGPSSLVGTARMIDTLPANLRVLGYTATNGWTCTPTPPYDTSAGTQMTCTREYTSGAPLASGQASPWVTYEVEAKADGQFANTMCVSAVASASGTPALDNVPENNCASYGMSTQPPSASANLSVIKRVAPASLPAGDILTYSLQVVNAGPEPSTDVTLFDSLHTLISNGVGPTGEGFIDAVIANGNTTGGSCNSAAGNAGVRDLSCRFPSIPVCTADSDCPVVTVRVRPGGDGGARQNQASALSSNVADPDYTDNFATVSSNIEPRADVTVQKSANPTSIPAGQDLTYVITARNAGPSKAADVQAVDTLPAGVYFVRAQGNGGGSCTTALAPGALTTGGETVTCSWAEIVANGQQTATIVVRPGTALRNTTITNNVAVSTSTVETNTGNNTGFVNTNVTGPDLDLLVNKRDSVDPVAVDDMVVYTITVTNNGPSQAQNVMVTDTLPTSGLRFKTLTSTGSCTTGPVDSIGGTISCSYPRIASGESVQIQVGMQGVTKGTVQNAVSITSDEIAGGFDRNAGNNQTTEPTTVRTKADLMVLSKTAAPATVDLMRPFIYTVMVRNNGPTEGDNVRVTDTLPANMVLTGPPVATMVSGSATSLSCSGAAGGSTVQCSFGTVDALAQISIAIPVKVTAVSSAAPTQFTNSATVTTDSKDEQPSNNSNSGIVTVVSSSLAGAVYVDADNDGVRDAGENGIANIAVTLSGTAFDGTPITRSTTTNSSGAYVFDRLPEGTYQIGEGPVNNAAYADGRDTIGSAGGTVGNDVFSNIPLPGNTAATSYLFGEIPASGISGRVYHDRDADGAIDGGEPGIAGVTVTLTGTDDLGATVTRTATTDATGAYSFTGLRPGSYTVTETQPGDYLPGRTSAGTGTNGASGGSVSGGPTGNAVQAIALTLNGSVANVNFGEVKAAQIGGSAYIDTNGDATRQPGETFGLPNVTVTLSGTDDLGAAVNATATTNATGGYSFANLRPGTYTVTETRPASISATGTQVGTGAATPGTGSTNAATQVIAGIGLVSESHAVNYNFGHQGDTQLTGSVYVDLNNNGRRDTGEPGIAGVAVSLSGNTGAGAAVCSVYPCTTTTDANGNYAFANLPASDGSGYSVRERDGAGNPSALLSAYADGTDRAGSVGGAPVGSAGNDVINGVVVQQNQLGAGYDFGELGGRVSGSVYVDADNDGVRGSGETGIGGIAVRLGGNTTTGVDICTLVNCNATTAADGGYRFEGLPAGTYTLVETQPPQYGDGKESAGTPAGTVNHALFDGTPGANTIGNITLAPGQEGRDYHFGERLGGLGGAVYSDLNNNGLRDAGEPGIAGVQIRLSGTDAAGQAITRTVTTGADGGYVFTGLPKSGAGGYQLEQQQPANYLDGKTTAGELGGSGCAGCWTTAPNQVPNLSRIGNIVFDPLQSGTNFNFGEVGGGSIAGKSWFDDNGNRVQDAGEGSLPNITITLTGIDDLGQPVNRTVQTGADGSYRFDGLRPSDAAGYTITQTQPTAYIDGGVVVGNRGGTAGTNQVNGVRIDSGVAAAGYDFPERASGLSGSVYVDINANGRRDSGEPGIAGVTVALSGPVTRTATTDADGRYRFGDLPAGTYTVTEQGGPALAIYKDGQETVGSAGGTAGNDTIGNIVLDAGVPAGGYDFGELTGDKGKITGQVWMNKPGGSREVREGDEPPLGGWRVVLYKDGAPVGSVAPVFTDASGRYTLDNVPADNGYELRFFNPGGALYGYPVPNPANGVVCPPQSNDPRCASGGRRDVSAIFDVVVASGATVIEENLPVDPTGVVYDAVSRNPVRGAKVTLIGPDGAPARPEWVVGGAPNVEQTTGEDGFYQFLLTSQAPAGTYTLRVVQPAAYLPPPSGMLPPASGVLPAGGGGLLQVVPTPGAPRGNDTVLWYNAFAFGAVPAQIAHNHIPLDPVLGGALRVVKTTPMLNVMRGSLVPYTIAVTNTLNAPLTHIAVRDLLPPGFKYRSGSGSINGVGSEPRANGREMTWPVQTFAAGETKTYRLVLLVGTGVSEGEYTNQAYALNAIANLQASNTGAATVRIVPDAVFDCTDIIGKVFDDRNANGYQDDGEPGIPNVRVVTVRGLLVTADAKGRFHVPCADIPQADRGSNFVMKLDERTLPSGYRVTTENPRVVRATRGKMVKLDFGAAIHRVVRIEVDAKAFANEGNELRPEWQRELGKLVPVLEAGVSVVHVSYRGRPGETGWADRRLSYLTDALRRLWADVPNRYPLQIETEYVEVR
ncbi:carboxypeptidase regulatory-like domain-containing protein [Cupriavidus sp. JZ107]